MQTRKETQPGFEPGTSASGGRRLIHSAIAPKCQFELDFTCILELLRTLITTERCRKLPTHLRVAFITSSGTRFFISRR